MFVGLSMHWNDWYRLDIKGETADSKILLILRDSDDFNATESVVSPLVSTLKVVIGAAMTSFDFAEKVSSGDKNSWFFSIAKRFY
jgi:hypothetical protein